jgi:hypothetical protein
LLSLKAGVNVPTEINKQKNLTLKLFFAVTWKVTDPDPEKNLFRIPDPRSRGQKGTGSRNRIRNTAPDSEQPFLENYVPDPDPDPSVRGTDPDPSIITQK